MKTFILKQLGYMSLIGILSGCSSVANFRTDDYKFIDRSTLPANKIEIYSTDNVGKKYRVIGGVVASADAGENATVVVDLLKKQAAMLGADAVINLRLSFNLGYWLSGIKSTGTAVVFEE